MGLHWQCSNCTYTQKFFVGIEVVCRLWSTDTVMPSSLSIVKSVIKTVYLLQFVIWRTSLTNNILYSLDFSHVTIYFRMRSIQSCNHVIKSSIMEIPRISTSSSLSFSGTSGIFQKLNVYSWRLSFVVGQPVDSLQNYGGNTRKPSQDFIDFAIKTY